MVYGISQDPTGRFRRQQECYGMPHHFRPYSPEQPLLWPPDLRDWLPEDHRVYTVSELVDALDLSAFYAP